MYSCPFCAEPHEPNVHRCPTFPDHLVPLEFIRSSQQKPALSLMTVGRPKVGKSFFVAALSLVLDNANIEGMLYEPMDDFTYGQVRNHREKVLQEGRLPLRTRNDAPQRPLLLSVSGLPDPEPRSIAIYDVPGEVFERFDARPALSPAIRQVTTAWMMVDLQSFQAGGPQLRLSELFQIYRKTLESYEVDYSGWHLIVIFTKVDRYQHLLPPEVARYVLSDELRSGLFQEGISEGRRVHHIDHPSYLSRMVEISERLREFTVDRIDGGRQFEQQVKRAGMKLAFCAVSSSGHDADADGRMAQVLAPCRILDPLLWALHYESVVQTQPLLLLIDDGPRASRIQSEAVLEAIRGRLAQSFALSICYLGAETCVRSAVQKPAAGRLSRPRLVGPALEKHPENHLVVLLTGGSIYDLEDFLASRGKSVMVVQVGEEPLPAWPQVLRFSPGDDPENLRQSLRRLAGLR